MEAAGPIDRAVADALGNFILERWLADDSDSAEAKWERLLDALRSSPLVAERTIDLYVRSGRGLAPRHRRTLYLLSIGFAPKQIAFVVGLTEHAIKEHLREARYLLGATTTTQAVAIAIRRGLLLDGGERRCGSGGNGSPRG